MWKTMSNFELRAFADEAFRFLKSDVRAVIKRHLVLKETAEKTKIFYRAYGPGNQSEAVLEAFNRVWDHFEKEAIEK